MRRNNISRILALAAALTVFIPSVAAQSTGIIPLMFEIIGYTPDNAYEVLATIATFVMMNVFSYVFFKQVVKKAPIVDVRETTGATSGRNMVAAFSVAFTLTGVAGAKSAGIPILEGFQGLVILTFAFGLLAAIALVFIGGPGATVGAGILGAGASAKAVSESASLAKGPLDELGGQAIASAGNAASGTYERLESAYNSVRSGEDEAEDGFETGDREEVGDAVKQFEEAVKLLENIEDEGLSKNFGEVDEELRDVLERFSDIDRRRETEEIEDIARRLRRIRGYIAYMHDALVVNYDGSIHMSHYSMNEDKVAFSKLLEGNLEDINSFEPAKNLDDLLPEDWEYGVGAADNEPSLLHDAAVAEADISSLKKDHNKDVDGVSKGFKEFDDAVEKAISIWGLLKILEDILKDLEEDTEEMERIERKRSLGNLLDETHRLGSEENKVEKTAEKLEEYRADIKNVVDNNLNALESSILQPDQAQIEELSNELGFIEDSGERLNRLIQAAQNSSEDTKLEENFGEDYGGGFRDICGAMAERLKDLETALASVDDDLQQMITLIEDEEREVYGTMENILEDVAENDTQTQMASVIGSEIQTWIKEGKTRYS